MQALQAITGRLMITRVQFQTYYSTQFNLGNACMAQPPDRQSVGMDLQPLKRSLMVTKILSEFLW